MLKSYFLIAWRNITRNKIFSLINVLGLTLGICACLVIFPIIHYELGFDNFHPDGKYIYRVIAHIQQGNEKNTQASVPPILPLAARKEVPGCETMAAYHFFTDSTIITEPAYFNIFKYDWVAGDPPSTSSRPFSVVLSEASARMHFGSAIPARVMGKELIFRDSLRVTVTGIVKDWEGNTDFPYNGFISLSTVPVSFLKEGIVLDKWSQGDMPYTSGAFIKLKKDAAPASIAARLTTFFIQHVHFLPDQKVSFGLQPLSDVHLNQKVWDGFPKGHIETQYILAGIAVFILLLGVINFINLSTALSIRRAKEVGIRKVLGSSRKALTIQFLTETGILTLFSLLLAVLLVSPVIHLFHTMIPARLHIQVFSPGMLLFLMVIAVTTTLLSGLYPARVLASWLPVLCLKSNGAPTGSEKWWLRKGLIVFQFTISLIFIISTMIISRQINYMRSEGLGFSTDAIITLDTKRDDTTRRVKVLAEKLVQVPGVRMIARQSFSPITDFHTMLPIQYKGRQVVNISSALQIADKNFIPLYKIKILAGENLRPSDTLRDLVINEAMVRAMGLTSPHEAVGQFLSLGDRQLPIIGVVADYHEYSYHYNILPVSMADLPLAEPSIAIKLATGGKSIDQFQKTIARIEKEWKSIYPELPFSYSFLDDAIQRMYEKEKETAFLLSSAMIITIFISCMGLFGLSMFTARQRTKEVGIRKVLGASAASIGLLLSRNVMTLVMLAAIIASPIAWYVTQIWLRDFAYRAHINPWIFVIAGLSALTIALLTISWQTIRTALINPAETLRTE